MTRPRLAYLCNAIDEATCLERGITSVSPAATEKVLQVASAPLSALRPYNNGITVTCSHDTLLFVKSNILRQFVYPLKCVGTLLRFGASTASEMNLKLPELFGKLFSLLTEL